MTGLEEYNALVGFVDVADPSPYLTVANPKLPLAADAMRDELLATIERLKCCGNCAEAHDVDDGWMGECWPNIHEATLPEDDATDVEPHDSCHFKPSRWQPREETT